MIEHVPHTCKTLGLIPAWQKKRGAPPKETPNKNKIKTVVGHGKQTVYGGGGGGVLGSIISPSESVGNVCVLL